MQLLKAEVFSFLDSWPPEQAAAALKDLERPLYQPVRDPTNWLLSKLPPKLLRAQECSRQSRLPLDTFPTKQLRTPAEAAPSSQAQS